ncbi:2-methylcitrate dehydratase [Sulfolobus sp. A20]|uniref:MmgE/PrpD family protein n=1 Tax=Saccharolobus sp. A20 TaxID=1891280 RepID=UPI000846236E|nr:MmgE/PrpD family protein [Sulfolobus sp. A20]TRM78716.1 MmgE/PrpD family protein [Sulfolobus sp. A20-N-F8]TRM81690.1 MmgE/PrpD family protein [Sulfolobus sp. D5]TRM87329.1 MmgE/PrpD family protein [Sulfolobus sp. E3]TRM87901.1 MmgE/PrpD family protein [Sulfolobus sp. C3]TRM95543.1 MmgE/PrpD family protein [Sulfolobus sp. A20-N-G8]
MEIAEKIADFVTSFSYEDLDEPIIKEAKRRIIDTIAVARGALNSPPHLVNKEVSKYFRGDTPLLFGGNSTVDFASFYNTFLIRYLDFNDTYLSKEPLHPSDMIGAFLAVASTFDLDGKKLIEAIAAGYEVGVKLCDATSLRKKGFDHVTFLQIGAAAGLAKLLDLNKEQTVNAISLTLVPNIALRETRSGELSMWKAGAAADASRKATFAVILAKHGLTGPAKPFSGRMGLINIIAKDFDTSAFDKLSKGGILSTSLKKYPVEYHAEAVVEAGKKISTKTDKITKIEVETYEAAKTIIADEEKWNPTNKETADHSLPYILAYTILKKDFWLEAYTKDSIFDNKVRDLMKKIVVYEKEDYTKVYPRELPVKVIVYTNDGGKEEVEIRNPRGYYNNPMTDNELEEKYLKLNGRKEELNILWRIEELKVKQVVTSIKGI